MKSLFVSIVLLIFFLLNSYGQASTRGFKNLEKGEYDKAIESFLKYLKENHSNSAANLGLAMVYSTDSYANHDFFKAWDYIVIANNNFNNLTTDENAFLKDYFGTNDPRRRNRTNRYNYDIEIKYIEDKLIKYVREENNVDIAEQFIKAYPNSKYYENVVHIRNHIKFRTAEKTNTLEAYRQFMKDYPDAAQVPKAIKACYGLAYDEAKNTNNIDAYNNYMKNYPDADQYFDALKARDQLAFENARKLNTIDDIENFINNYPKALQIMNARSILRKLLYERAKQVNTIEAYDDFISKYPEGEYFVDIFNLKASVLGKKMSEKFEGNKEAIIWIKGFDFEDNNDIGGGVTETSDGKTIIAGTRQKSDEEGTQSWLISLDNNGKVIWNKPFGGQVYSHTNQIMTLPGGDLLVTGWSGRSTDTTFRKSWMFKVSQTGTGIWEKNVEGNEIKDFLRTPDGEYYLSGYQFDDSFRIRTFIEKLNPDLKKLWSRQYNHRGSLDGIATNANNELICVAGRWNFKLTPQGYLLWEKILPATDSLSVVRIINNQSYLCGSWKGSPLILKINESGTSAPEILPSPKDSSYTITCLPLPGKRLITLSRDRKDAKVKVLDEKGIELKSLSLNNCQVSGPNCIFVNDSGEVFLTISVFNENNKSDIGVLKLVF